MDPVLDYYNRTPKVTLDTPVPQLDPRLLQAIQATAQAASAQPTQNVAAKEQQLAQQQAMQQQEAMRQQQQQAAGLGNQIKPQGDQALFPLDVHEQKRLQRKAERAEMQAKVDVHLARPEFIVLPEHVQNNARKAYGSLINQQAEEIPEFEKARPEVYALGVEMQKNILKRFKHLSDLNSQIAFTNYERKKNESEKEWEDRVSTTLKSQLKIYNTALAGTSDALSTQERSSLSPELNEWIFEPKSWIRLGGAGAMKSNIEGFKQKMMVLHDIILNEMNDGYNILAAQTSPDYADRALGFQQFDPFQTLPYRPRLSRNSPPDVIRGRQTMAQGYYERQAKMQATADEYYSMMDQMINEQKVKPAVAMQIFSKKYMQDFGIALPERGNPIDTTQKPKK
jgi:hypothetical protein